MKMIRDAVEKEKGYVDSIHHKEKLKKKEKKEGAPHEEPQVVKDTVEVGKEKGLDEDLLKMEKLKKVVNPETLGALKQITDVSKHLKDLDRRNEEMGSQVKEVFETVRGLLPADQLKKLGEKIPGENPPEDKKPPGTPDQDLSAEELIKRMSKEVQDKMREQVVVQMGMKAAMMELDTKLMQEKFWYEKSMVLYEHQQKLFDMTKAAMLKVREMSESMFYKSLEVEWKLYQGAIKVLGPQ